MKTRNGNGLLRLAVLLSVLAWVSCSEKSEPECDDDDGDGVCNEDDVCPDGDDALDGDGDGVPDACDPCPLDASDDSDGDGVCDSDDVCPDGDDAVDGDGDGAPDACDPCPLDASDDSDGDGVCDSDDVCPDGDDAVDADGDGVPDACDLCPGSPDSRDADGDGVPDGCDLCPGSPDSEDADGDGVPDACDICPDGPDDIDEDGDTLPDACDLCLGDNATLDLNHDGVCDGLFLGSDPVATLPSIVSEIADGQSQGVAWSAAAHYLAVVATEDAGTLEVYSFDGTGLTLVTFESFGAGMGGLYASYAISWNLVSDHIAVSGSEFAGPDFEARVYVFSFDGTALALLTEAAFTGFDAEQVAAGLCWSPDGSRLGGIAQGGIFAFEFDGTSLSLIQNPTGQAYRYDFYGGCDWSPDSRYLVTAGWNNAGGSGLQVFDADAVSFDLFTPADTLNRMFAVSWSPDGAYILTTSVSPALRLYGFDMATATFSDVLADWADLGSGRTAAVQWHGDSFHAAVANRNALYIFGMDTDTKELVLLDTRSHGEDAMVHGVRFSADGRYLAVRRQSAVDVYEVMP